MTLNGDKGSHYRGRLLVSINTSDSDNPKTKIRDLKFDVTTNPSPNVKVKSYLLKIALYEGLEIPELKKYSDYQIIASCGPYEVASKMK
jgi:hypothetical protein